MRHFLSLSLQHSFSFIHDDVIKWKHFPRYWPFVRGIHRSSVNYPHKGQWHGALLFSLICALHKRLSKQSWGWWFETPSRSLWRYFNELQFDISRHNPYIVISDAVAVFHNRVCVAVAMVIFAIHENLCIDFHNARKFEIDFQNYCVIHISRNNYNEITKAS